MDAYIDKTKSYLHLQSIGCKVYYNVWASKTVILGNDAGMCDWTALQTTACCYCPLQSISLCVNAGWRKHKQWGDLLIKTLLHSATCAQKLCRVLLMYICAAECPKLMMRKSWPLKMLVLVLFMLFLISLWENRPHYCFGLMNTTDTFDYSCRLPIML